MGRAQLSKLPRPALLKAISSRPECFNATEDLFGELPVLGVLDASAHKEAYKEPPFARSRLWDGPYFTDFVLVAVSQPCGVVSCPGCPAGTTNS